LYLLDEADSHLHYQNIDRLWKILKPALLRCSKYPVTYRYY
jgi:predicted ATP-dependent endonuclease of OLD family